MHEPFKGDGLPTLTGSEAGVMVMGGPQMVSEHHKRPYLATSTETVHPNQAFSHGETTFALQFHPEVTLGILTQWQQDLADAIGRPGSRSMAEQDAGFAAHDVALKDWYRGFLDNRFSR